MVYVGGARYVNAPVTEELEWQLQGHCNGEDPSLFFPEGEYRYKTTRLAKAICKGCPVITQCRTWALDRQELYGVWGGLSESERQAMLKGRSCYGRRSA